MTIRYGKRSVVAQLERRTKMQTKVLLQVVGLLGGAEVVVVEDDEPSGSDGGGKETLN